MVLESVWSNLFFFVFKISIVRLDTGKEWLRVHWNLCHPINGTEDIDDLKDWLGNVWTNLAMVNYPYSANFLAPLPAYPVKVSQV